MQLIISKYVICSTPVSKPRWSESCKTTPGIDVMTEIISSGVYQNMKVIFINVNLCTFVIHTGGFIKVFSVNYSMDFVPQVFLFQVAFLLVCVCMCFPGCTCIYAYIFFTCTKLRILKWDKTYMCFRVWFISLKMMISSYCMCSYSKVNFILFFLI